MEKEAYLMKNAYAEESLRSVDGLKAEMRMMEWSDYLLHFGRENGLQDVGK